MLRSSPLDVAVLVIERDGAFMLAGGDLPCIDMAAYREQQNNEVAHFSYRGHHVLANNGILRVLIRLDDVNIHVYHLDFLKEWSDDSSDVSWEGMGSAQSLLSEGELSILRLCQINDGHLPLEFGERKEGSLRAFWNSIRNLGAWRLLATKNGRGSH